MQKPVTKNCSRGEKSQIYPFPSIVINKLILMTLKSNAVWFGNESYRQLTGTAMGTPVVPNYAKLWTISRRTCCVIVSKKLDYHLWYGFVLLMIFSSYGPVIKTSGLQIIFQNLSDMMSERNNIPLNIYKNLSDINFYNFSKKL